MSIVTARALSPSSAAAAAAPSPLRSARTTRAPSRTNRVATARPMPSAAPVTSAVLPSSWPMLSPLGVRRPSALDVVEVQHAGEVLVELVVAEDLLPVVLDDRLAAVVHG